MAWTAPPSAEWWWWRPLPWTPTIQCRDAWRSANTPTPARWGPPWAWPLRPVPTRSIIASLRNGVPLRCWCLPGRCQGKLGVIERGPFLPMPWPGGIWFRPEPAPPFGPWPRFPVVAVFKRGEAEPPLVVTGDTVLPGGTTGLVSVENRSAAPLTITVVPGVPGQRLTIKDASGTAADYPLTVICQPTVDGFPNYLLATAFASLSIYWMGSQWGTL